jgi:adenine deaminase
MSDFKISGNIVDVLKRKIFPGTVVVRNGIIAEIIHEEGKQYSQYIMPGFIDAHIHVESSLLIPSEFARLAVVHGTVATVSDPHEIANVLGLEGVRYMIRNGKRVPFHFYFGAPSCVPASSFETAGATLTAEDIRQLFHEDGLKYLSEMMNYPGVLTRSPLVMDKINVAKEYNLPIDGHAPGLRGEDAACYISAGISTDHECVDLNEALGKVKCGMKILIREGSAAKNYAALHPLIKKYPEMVMFCSDDKHPHELVKEHINELVHRSIVDHGYDTMDVIRCACYNPIIHYNLDVGYLQTGQPADFIVVNNLRDFAVQQTYIKGTLVAKNGQTCIPRVKEACVNHFNTSLKSISDFAFPAHGNTIQVIQAFDEQLVTKAFTTHAKIDQGMLVSDPDRDILKLVVVNRYANAPVAIGFINNFGLKKGAIASSVAHDSHNIIAVGVSDKEICEAVNALISNKGGLSIASEGKTELLPLPVAGLMSAEDGYAIAESYANIDLAAKKLGSPLSAPFMTLSFMALLVIPSLKLSDKGLFDGNAFKFTDIQQHAAVKGSHA